MCHYRLLTTGILCFLCQILMLSTCYNSSNYNIAVFVLLIKYPMKGERLSRETNFRGELHLENKDWVSTISCRNIVQTVFDGTMSWERLRIYKIRKKITIESIVRFYCVEKDALANTRLALFEGVRGERKSWFIEQKSIFLRTLSRNNINLAC